MKSFIIVCLLASIYNSHGCTMEGVSVWQLPITVRIEDYHEGIIFQRAISDIGGFTLTSHNDLNGGPYVDAAIENSSFVLRANEAYKEYEENETSDLISLTFSFACTNGATLSPLTIRIEISDNNNNPPLFKTPDTTASATATYEFTIAPPVPAGFLVTNSVSDIIVRDIDLTTYKIDFEIEDNPYVEIAYDEAASTDPKEFKAMLKTTTYIRSIPEPIILTINATAADQTGGPSITRSTTVTIHGSADLELPLEPVFSQAFYFTSYTENDQVIQEQSITLQQGYDELVDFSLEGDYAADHFTITFNGNQVILSVTNPLPAEALQEAQIYLVVKAAREYTSGTSATIVVRLPQVVGLEFQRPHYEGEIKDTTLQLTQLILNQAYQGDHSSTDVNMPVERNFAPVVITVTNEHNYAPSDVTWNIEANYARVGVTLTAVGNYAPTDVTVNVDRNFSPVDVTVIVEGNYAPTNVIVTVRLNYAPTAVTVTIKDNYALTDVIATVESNYANAAVTVTVGGNYVPNYVVVPVRLNYYPINEIVTILNRHRSNLVKWDEFNMVLDMGKGAIRRMQPLTPIWQYIWHVTQLARASATHV